MKKLFTLLILTYLLFTINSSAVNQSLNENNSENEKILKVGVLLPLSGEFQDIGESFLKAIQLALFDISNEYIKIYPKDSKGNALDAYRSSKEFEEQGINIVIGPIFYESLERLGEINKITFISLTNKTKEVPKNTIAFGVNIESQVDAIKKYFNKIDVSKTLLLSPKSITTSESKFISPRVCLCSNSLSSCLCLYRSDFSKILILRSKSFFLSLYFVIFSISPVIFFGLASYEYVL